MCYCFLVRRRWWELRKFLGRSCIGKVEFEDSVGGLKVKVDELVREEIAPSHVFKMLASGSAQKS